MENSLHEHRNRGEYLNFLHPTTDLYFVLPKASRPQYRDTRGRGLDFPPYQLPHAPGGSDQWGPWSRYKRIGLLIGYPRQRTWPHCPRTLVERVAAIVPGEPEPWPGFRGIGGSGAPNI